MDTKRYLLARKVELPHSVLYVGVEVEKSILLQILSPRQLSLPKKQRGVSWHNSLGSQSEQIKNCSKEQVG